VTDFLMTDRDTPVLTDDTDDQLPIDATLSPDAPVVEAPVVVLPDRADAPVSEITERFLRAIVAQVPLDRIEELHLFSPLKQGGVETGIAVVAARVTVVLPPVEMAPELPLADESTEGDAEDTIDHTGDEVLLADDLAVNAALAADVVAEDVVAEDVVAVDGVADAVDGVASDDVAIDDGAADATSEPTDESPYADTPGEVDATEVTIESIVIPSDVVAAEAADDEVVVDEMLAPAAPTAIVRHTVYTARYRLVQKGPERGKWEADVKAEADAPLITVEMVVRGVQRRAGEESEILRYSAKQLAKALRVEWPAPAV
jgi:hypothetical protein